MSWVQTTKHLLLGGIIGSGITCTIVYAFSCKHKKADSVQYGTMNNMAILKKEIDSISSRLNQLETQSRQISEIKADKSQLDHFKQEFIKMHQDLERDQRSLNKKALQNITNDTQRRPSDPKDMVSM